MNTLFPYTTLFRSGVGLGFMSFFTRAVIGALKAFPLLNAEIRGDEIIVKHYYDIGIAVSTDEGLVVPVLRNADRLSFAEIERGIEELARPARRSCIVILGTFTCQFAEIGDGAPRCHCDEPDPQSR